MKQKNENVFCLGGVGCKFKVDLVVFRYFISFNVIDYVCFLVLFDQFGMCIKVYFIIVCIFGELFKVIKIDKVVVEYYIWLIVLYFQYRGIVVNYNQVVKVFNINFLEKKVFVFFYKLEKVMIEFVDLN